MNFKQIFTPKRLVTSLVFALIIVLFYFHSSAFMPFILAVITALVLEPPVQFFQKTLKLKKRLPAVIIVFVLFLLFLALLAYFAITRLVSKTIHFVERLPGYTVQIIEYVESVIGRFNETVASLPQIVIDEIDKFNTSLMTWVTNAAQDALAYLAGWVQGIPYAVIVTLIYLIALFLISLDLPKYKRGFFNLFEEEHAEKVRYMLNRSARFFTGFFKAQFLVSIIIFVVSYIGLLIITPEHALVMAIVIWIIDLIPVIGSIVILAPWATFHLITGDTQTGIELFILAGILLVIRRTVEPKVMGDQIGLPAFPTLLGLWFGVYFFGAIGLIIGPLTMIALYAAKEAGLINIHFKI